jgi:hypothetical protein
VGILDIHQNNAWKSLEGEISISHAFHLKWKAWEWENADFI